jgi:hypothetical protein
MAMKNKIYYMCVTIFMVTLLGVWGLTSCGQSNFDEIKDIPTAKTSSGHFLDRSRIAYHFGNQRGFNYKKINIKKDVEILLLDLKYEVVDYYFLLKFNNWFQKLKFENGIMPLNQKENLDCDNFAMMYKSLMSISSYKSESKNEPAVALISVRQVNPFGGIPSGELHMLNLIFTNNGWYVFEPQTGDLVKFEEYPNQEYIYQIIL